MTESGGRGRRVMWVGVGAAVAVVAAAAFVVTQGGGGGGDGGGCLSGLAGNVPVDAGLVAGSDLDRARDAGLDIDGSVEDAGKAVLDTGVQLDPLSQRRIQFFESSTEGTGYAVGDIECWVGEGAQEFVARGSFDAEAITTSEAGGGVTVVRGDVLALDTDDPPAPLFDAPSEGTPRAELVEAFDRHGAVTFAGISVDDGGDGDDAPWAGVGLAKGDVWELLVVWAFPSDQAADASVGRVLNAVHEGQVPAMVSGDVDDELRRDGAALWLRVPLKEDISRWNSPLQMLDPMFSALSS